MNTPTDSRKDGGAAFPGGAVRKSRPAHDPGANFHVTSVEEPKHPGMTLRDYFAAKAMAALIGTAAAPCLNGLDGMERRTAQCAYTIADAMLAARTQPSQLSDTGRKPE